MPAVQQNDFSKPLSLDAWCPPPGTDNSYLPDEHFIRYTEEMQMRGDAHWPPSIISFNGHPIPLPNVDIQYIGRGSTFLKCLVTFKKRALDPQLGLLVESHYHTLPAWQGDNNIIHLMELLPAEDHRDVNMQEFYESEQELDTDYLNRLRRFYTDEELLEKVPEVFYYLDPALTTISD